MNEGNSWCVYRHTVPDGRKYIGIAEKPVRVRWANGKGYKSNPAFWECIKTVGWDNIQHDIVGEYDDRFEALDVERRLIKEEGTLWPKGFNRRTDNPACNRIKHKREIGDKYGYCVVEDYWPDENRYKIYKLRCVCGKSFVIHGWDITDNISCGCMDKKD